MSEFNENDNFQTDNVTSEDKNIINKKENKGKKIAKTIICILAVIILCGVCSYGAVTIALDKAQKKIVVYQDTSETTVKEQVVSDISDIVKKISSSVVEVYTEQTVYNSFVGSYISSGAGSGVIISEDGYVITNNHVIENASSITVKTTDGNSFVATLIGTDEVTDIAVIKIEATSLNPAILGNSSTLVVGQGCIAIGNPLGTLGGTVTNGIISALEREVTIDSQAMNLLQTNAAISPGNSGGGLFALDGKLIGIVNAKSSASDVEGIGFAIPIDTAKKVAEDLIEFGYVKGRAYIGINCISVDTVQKAFSLGVSDYGVYVQTINSANALSSGLKTGDLIVKIDDHDIECYSDMQAVLLKHYAGDTVDITVLRGKEERTISCVLSEKAE